MQEILVNSVSNKYNLKKVIYNMTDSFGAHMTKGLFGL